jgi:hypothetical protein
LARVAAAEDASLALALVVLRVNGRAVRVPIGELRDALHRGGLSPVRRLGTHRKQEHVSGWLALEVDGMKMHVPYESGLEKAHILQLLYTRQVLQVITQPVVMIWPDGPRGVRYFPDLLGLTPEGKYFFAEVKPEKRQSLRVLMRLDLARRTLATAGIPFQLYGSISGQRRANLFDLAMHRNPCHDLHRPCELAQLHQRRTLGGVIDSAGGGPIGRAAAMHLLASGAMSIDLDYEIGEASAVRWGDSSPLPPKGGRPSPRGRTPATSPRGTALADLFGSGSSSDQVCLDQSGSSDG